MRNTLKGFTLTELLIVVAIVAILAAIALPQYLQGEAARASEAISQLSAIRLGEEGYKTDAGSYFPCLEANQPPNPPPSCWDTISVDNPEANAQRFFNYEVFTNATNSQFCAVATRRDQNPTNNPNQNQTICLNNSGEYYGTHPNSPNPTSATNVPPAVCPNTC